MPNIQGKDAANATIFIRSTRAGTDGEPHFSTEDTIDRIGPVAETAPASDTASSGLNGRLQRVAQRITSLIALLPSSLGQKNKAGSLGVTLASDEDALPVTGTFFQTTQPVSVASLPALAAGTNNIGDVDVLSLPLAFDAGAVSATTQRIVIATNQSALPVTGTFFQATQPVSAASLPLPTGAALESEGNLAAIATDAAAMEALLTTIDTDTSALAGAVLGTEVQVDVVTTVEASHKTLVFATGTVASSGDNTILDISALAGYSAGDRIVITALRLQAESATATTIVIKNGSTSIARILCQTQGSGVDRQYETGRELRLSVDADLLFNLSGANSVGYSIEYFLETP